MMAVGWVGYSGYSRDGFSSRGLVKANSLALSNLQHVKELNTYSINYGSGSCFELPSEKSQEWFVKIIA